MVSPCPACGQLFSTKEFVQKHVPLCKTYAHETVTKLLKDEKIKVISSNTWLFETSSDANLFEQKCKEHNIKVWKSHELLGLELT